MLAIQKIGHEKCNGEMYQAVLRGEMDLVTKKKFEENLDWIIKPQASRLDVQITIREVNQCFSYEYVIQLEGRDSEKIQAIGEEIKPFLKNDHSGLF